MSQQQYEIPIAAVVVGSSSGDFFDQELEQRITAEIQEKTNQIMTIEKEMGDIKRSVLPIVGLEFMRRWPDNTSWIL